MAVTLRKMKQKGIERSPAPDRHAEAPARITLPGPIGFIGAGKVGTALAALLHQRGIDVRAVSGRTLTGSRRMAQQAHLEAGTATGRAATVAHSAIVFLTVPDDAIEPLCRDIAGEGGWRPGQGVVHCSGALPSSILQSAADMGALVASFHPLQAFASLDAALEHIPGSTIALEGNTPLVEQLEQLVHLLGGVSVHLTATEKTLYHAAAVIASNYTVTLASLAANLLVSAGVAPDSNTALHYLMPLIKGTVDNLDKLGLPNALTGPIARGDAGTVLRHIEALSKSDPDLARIYRDLARATLPLAEQKGQLSGEAAVTLLEAIDKT